MDIRRLSLVAVMTAGLSACSDPLAPESIQGTFMHWEYAQARASSTTHLFEGVSRRLEIGEGVAVIVTRTMVTDLATLERTLQETRHEMTYELDGARLRTNTINPGGDAVLIPAPDFYAWNKDTLAELDVPSSSRFVRVLF